MANIKSAKKRAVQSEKRRQHNASQRRTLVRFLFVLNRPATNAP
ncbi:MAG: 30S ribosomal protein S20 [Haemophilus parainfluenzae]|nr:30S ribosomal protein S20 [Haemophilus parainfluenzae]